MNGFQVIEGLTRRNLGTNLVLLYMLRGTLAVRSSCRFIVYLLDTHGVVLMDGLSWGEPAVLKTLAVLFSS